MNTSLSWIKEYVPDLECTDQEYMDAMTLSGTKVEGYEQLDKNQIIPKGKVIMTWGEWRMVRDYIIILEGKLHIATGQTFGSIREEMTKIFGIEKVKEFYDKK